MAYNKQRAIVTQSIFNIRESIIVKNDCKPNEFNKRILKKIKSKFENLDFAIEPTPNRIECVFLVSDDSQLFLEKLKSIYGINITNLYSACVLEIAIEDKVKI